MACAFQRAVRAAYPNLFVIVKHLKREECATASAIRQAEMGCPPAKKRAKYDFIHKKINALYETHRSGTMTSEQLLRRARHVMHVFR